MNILFTICGRRGSKGFKNKNLKKINGIPLVYYTLSAIKLYQEAHSQDHVVVAVNTDSEELLRIIYARKTNFNMQTVKRRAELAGDRVAKAEVIKDTYLECKKYGIFDAVVDLDITSPMRRMQDIEAAVRTLKNKKCDLVFSVVSARRNPYFNMVEKRQGCYQKVRPSHYTTRQEAPEVYELNASIYAYAPEFLENKIEKTILEYNCEIIQMKDYLVLDIDSGEDFALMSILMEYFGQEDKELNRVIASAKELSAVFIE